MKKLIIITFVSIISLWNTGKAQAQNINDPFVGTWHWQDGNVVFIVNLWSQNDIIFGHYKKVIVDANGIVISEIYNSNKEVGTSGQNWPYAIYAGEYDQSNNYIGGPITDNTIQNASRDFYNGKFVMTLQYSCLGCPKTALWTAEKVSELREPNEPDFNIPTNIVLTKVN